MPPKVKIDRKKVENKIKSDKVKSDNVKNPKKNNPLNENEDKSNQLWLEKYRPITLEDYVGVKDICKQVSEWIKGIGKKVKGTPPFLLLHGKAGVGKTTLAHIIMKEYGYDVIEINASDHRTKTNIHDNLGSIAGYSIISLEKKKIKNGVILDEIDGVAGGGVIQEIINSTIGTQIIKKGSRKPPVINYKFPVICTCNSIKEKKLQPLLKLALVIRINLPKKQYLKKLAKKIIKNESIDINEETLDKMISNKGLDYRELINSLNFYNLLNSIDFCDKSEIDNMKKIMGECSPLEKITNFLTNKYDSININRIIESDPKVFYLDLYSNIFTILKKKEYWNKNNSNKNNSNKNNSNKNNSNILEELMDNIVYGDMINHKIYDVQDHDIYKYLTMVSITGNIVKLRDYNYDEKMTFFLMYHNKFNSMCQENALNLQNINDINRNININDMNSQYYIYQILKNNKNVNTNQKISDSEKHMEKIEKKINNIINID